MATTNVQEFPKIDEQKLQNFAGQVLLDMSASSSVVMTLIGHELGLFKAMVNESSVTAATLAQKTGTFERYVQEWLNCQAAGGYIKYDAATKTYSLPFEHALVLAVEDSPVFMAAGPSVTGAIWLDKDKIMEAFKTGKGIGWHEHHHSLFFGVESFFRVGYRAHLVNEWIPSLTGINEKLEKGGRAADIGCGHGASTIIMAQRFPNSKFYGFDYHRESIDVAKQRAKDAGLTNVTFEVASADDFKEGNFDLICYMDSFHDMGNPLQAIRYAHQKLAEGGSLMLVEPASFDNLEENFNPIGRLYYAGSTALCVPHSHSQEGDYCLGAQAGPAKVEEIAKEAGYKHFRIAQRTPVNLILEVR